MKLVIFDVDGTLIDSQALILAAMTGAFEAAALAPPSREAVRAIIGLSLPQAMAVLAPDADPATHARLSEGYRDSFQALRAAGGAEAEVAFYPGALACLGALDEAGYLLGVATGKARRGLDHLLDSHGLRTRFIATQTADDAPSKPHPGMVLNCLALSGVAPGDAVVIGDTEFDMAMARAAGTRALGVGWGYHDRTRLSAGGAETVVSDYTEVPAAVARLVGAP
ncbi:MAG: HAD-IA family hydrolase [Pseudomonadota bacterium]